MDAMRRQLKGTAFLQFFALWALFTAAGCDRFLVSLCNFEDVPGCNVAVDGVPKPSDMSAVKDMAPYPVPQREFEWRAKIIINQNTKFIGMYQGEALTWKDDGGLHFQSSKLDLKHKEEAYRAIAKICDKCPPFSVIDDIAFATDQIYAAGGLLYKLRHQGGFGIYYYPSNVKKQVPGIALSDLATPRPFAHPSINFLVASIQETRDYKAGIEAFHDSSARENVNVDTNQLTSVVVGDLDTNDQTMNGLELILFGDSTPHWLAHLASGSTDSVGDLDLLGALANTIALTKSDESPIDAAFIADLNNDSLPDLIYARKGSLYVTSYMGNRLFKNWSAPVKLDEASGESIKSLVAVNITDAAFPDLVIETNKAVHFYQNKAK